MGKSSSKASKTVAKRGGAGNSGGGAHMRILNMAAQMKAFFNKDSVDRSKIKFHTGIVGKSTVLNALKKLKDLKWMNVTPQEITITELGMQNAVVSEKPETKTNKDYWESLKKQHKLKSFPCRVFDHIQDGRTYTAQELADALNNGKKNSTVANAITELKRAEIITAEKGKVRLTDDMFQNEPRPSHDD